MLRSVAATRRGNSGQEGEAMKAKKGKMVAKPKPMKAEAMPMVPKPKAGMMMGGKKKRGMA